MYGELGGGVGGTDVDQSSTYLLLPSCRELEHELCQRGFSPFLWSSSAVVVSSAFVGHFASSEVPPIGMLL